MTTRPLRTIAGGFRRLLIFTGADRMIPLCSRGASTRSVWAHLVPSHQLYSQPTIRQLTSQGIRFELDVSDYMEWCTYFGLAIEPREALWKLVKPDATVVDVGVNIGETLMNIARLVGEGGRVFGFEVNPRTLKKCQRNLSLNAFRNIALHGVGLGRSPGRLRIFSPSLRNSGGDRLRDLGEDAGGAARTVAVTTLDAFATEHGLAHVDLIKIDVEGFEMNVIAGALETLRRDHPVLFVELDDANLREQGSSAASLVAFLESLAYSVTSAETELPVSSRDDLSSSHFDIICT